MYTAEPYLGVYIQYLYRFTTTKTPTTIHTFYIRDVKFYYLTKLPTWFSLLNLAGALHT